MVTALLRALGFDDEAEAPPGEGQDRAPVGSGQDVGVGAASADVNQNTDLGLSRAEAAVACGPAAAVELARRYGDNIPVDAVIAAARQNGWRSPDGMSTGPQGFARTMRQLGYDVTVADLDASGQGPGWQQTQQALAGGQSVAIDTPGHYYQATDYDPARGYRLGDTVGAGRYVQPGGIAGLGYGAPRNAIIATPGAGAQARGTGQPQLLSAQGGQQAPGQNGPPSVQQVAIRALTASDPQANNAEIADIMAAGALKESGANPNGPAGDGGASIGLWQLHSRGLGAGMSEAERRDPATAAARIAPAYQQAYAAGIRQGYDPERQRVDLATYTYINAEHPADGPGTTRHATMTGPTAQQFRAHYADVDAHSRQQQELQIGGGYAPPSGAPGQATAQAPSGPLQQAWEAAQPAIQQLLAQAGGAATAVGERVASLGATPAYAETSGPAPAGPPPGPTPQVQQPPVSLTAAGGAQMGPQGQPPPSPGIGRVAQGVADAVGGAARAVQQAAQSGQPPPPTPPAPAGPAAPGTPFGQALDQARRAAASQGAPPAPPATAPAADIAQTVPPTGTPGQGPNWGTTPGPTAPPSGLPPDTETEHWDNRILAWVPKTPPPGTENWTGGGRYVLAPGVQPATAGEGLNVSPAPNPPGTPVQYVPNQPGTYPQGYFDGVNWHAPTAASQAQGASAVELAPGLSFVRPSPNSPSGTLFYTDPNTHAITQAPYTLGDPMPAGLGQPGPQPQTPLQTAQTAEAQARATQMQGSLNIPVEVGGRRYDPRTGADLGPVEQSPLAAAQTAAANRSLNVPVESGGVMYDQYGNALGPPAQSPLAQAQTAAANRGLNVPVESGGLMYDQYGNAIGPPTQSPLATAQTQVAQESMRLPREVAGRVQTPQFDDQGNFTGFQDTGAVPMSASEQALLDERTREFGTLSAYQQSQAEQSKASLAQNESQFQQSLSEKQAESARPYSQMTKAEQAQNAIQQQELGLKKEQLGLSEAEAANKLENLPRGGIMRVDPFTGQSSLINAPEPEDIRMVGSQIYIPGGRQVSMLGQQISGGPNPYAGVPTGGGGMFQYPGAAGGGVGGQQASPYQNWGGQGGGGWGGGGMSSSPGWQQPRQQQGWMGSGY